MDIPTLAKYLTKRKPTLTSAESLTSGSFQSQLAATPQAVKFIQAVSSPTPPRLKPSYSACRPL